MTSLTRTLFASAALVVCCAPEIAVAQSAQFNVPREPVADAVRRIGRQSGAQIIVSGDVARGRTGNAVSGAMNVEQALAKLLAGTGLEARKTGDRTFVVVSAQAGPVSAVAEQIPEILVSARKKRETVLDVPGQITVRTEKELRANGTTDAQSLALNNPGLVYSVTFSGTANPRITIRGVGDDDFNPNGSSSAAIHVNGIYQGTNGLLNSQFFDIAQVEILKGPQGTLYGRNATAGAINILTNRPDDEFGGYLDVDVGNFGLVRSEGAVNLPLSDAVRVRAAGLLERSSGFFEHLGTGPLTGFSRRPGIIPGQGEVPAQDSWGGTDRAFGRITAEADLTTDTLLTVRATVGVDNSELPLQDVTPDLWAAYSARAFFNNPADPAFVAYAAALDDDPFTVFTNALPRLDAEQVGINAELSHNFSDSLSGVILIGYEGLDRAYTTGDSLPIQAADYVWDNQFEQFTIESRLTDDNTDGFGWQVGGFFLDDEVDFSTILQFRNTGLWQTDIQTDYVQQRRAFGLFGSADWTLAEWFTLEGGLRYSSDEVTFAGRTTNLDPFGTFTFAPTFAPLGSVFIRPPVAPGAPLVFDEALDDDAVTWKVNAIIRPVEGMIAYAGVSTGFKAGGFDGSTILAAVEAAPIAPETVTAYEGGVKYQTADGVFFAEGNVFLYEFEDYQSTALVNTGGFNTNVRANVADARITGAEFTAALNPVEGLTLRGSLAMLDSEITNFTGVQTNIEGNDLPFSPDLSWNTAVIYETPVTDRFGIRAQIDAAGTGAHFQTINNNDQVEAYAVGNARLTFLTDKFDVAVWVRNFTDEDYNVGFFPGGTLSPDSIFKGPPRTYGVNLRVQF